MVAGAWAKRSVRTGLFMQRVCCQRACVAWAMLALSCGSAEASREASRRDPDDATEVAVELALVVEADRLRRFGDQRPALEELSRLPDAQVGQVLVGRQP